MRAARVVGAALSALVAAGCSGEPATAESGVVAVSADDTSCTVAAAELPAGAQVFRIANTGAKVTEFYVYGPDDRIIGEVENLAPGLTRELRVELSAGAYEMVCKPGMTGDGIRHPLTVTGTASASAVAGDPVLDAAAATYAGYVRAQSDDLLKRTTVWVATIKAGDVRAARDGFASTRAPYERIEPVAESFAGLDPRIDARDTDVAAGEQWTGFHRLEKTLWVDGRADPAVAEQLLADVTALHGQLRTQTFTVLEVANGAKSLLDEVATKKVTGEEDRFSRTDLWDFAANVDGCRAAIGALRPAVDRRDAVLGLRIDEQLAAVDALLARYRDATGRYVDYRTLNQGQVRELSDAVNALAEPVSHLAAALSASR